MLDDVIVLPAGSRRLVVGVYVALSDGLPLFVDPPDPPASVILRVFVDGVQAIVEPENVRGLLLT